MRGYHAAEMTLVGIQTADILLNITFRAILTVFYLLDQPVMLLVLAKLSYPTVIGKVRETIRHVINQNWARSNTMQIILIQIFITNAIRNFGVATELVLVMLEKFWDGITMPPKKESRHSFFKSYNDHVVGSSTFD